MSKRQNGKALPMSSVAGKGHKRAPRLSARVPEHLLAPSERSTGSLRLDDPAPREIKVVAPPQPAVVPSKDHSADERLAEGRVGKDRPLLESLGVVDGALWVDAQFTALPRFSWSYRKDGTAEYKRRDPELGWY